MITINLDCRNYAIVSLSDVVGCQDDIYAALELKNVSVTDVLATSIFASYYIDSKGNIRYVLKNNVIVLDDDYAEFAEVGPIERLGLIDGNFTWLSDFIKDFAAKHNMTRSADEIRTDIISAYRHVAATELMIRIAAKCTVNYPAPIFLPENESEYEEDDELPF